MSETKPEEPDEIDEQLLARSERLAAALIGEMEKHPRETWLPVLATGISVAMEKETKAAREAFDKARRVIEEIVEPQPAVAQADATTRLRWTLSAARHALVFVFGWDGKTRFAPPEPLLLDVVERNQELLSLIERFLDDCCDADALLVNVRAAMGMNVTALKKGGRTQ